MQDSLEDTERTSTNSSAIGELDTSPVATEFPAILRADGSEYQIRADSTPDVSEESAETIEVEVPCMNCDTKNKMQYSGHIPALVSCVCSHCGEDITINSSSDEASLSIAQLADRLEQYQTERLAYIAGQQSTQDLDNVVRNGRVVTYLSSLFAFSSFFYLAFSTQAILVTAPSPFRELLLTIFVFVGLTSVPFLVLAEFTILPHILSWYANIPGNNRYKTVMKFFEGYED